MMDDGWYDIAFIVSPDATVRDICSMIRGLDALDVIIDWSDMGFTKDGLYFEGQNLGSMWDAIVKWCEKTEGIDIDWNLMSSWFGDMEAERWRSAWKATSCGR